MKALHRYANRLVDLRYKGMRRSVLIILICLVANHSFAQASKEMLQVSSFSDFDYDVKPLTVGDKVPDIFFHNVLNYKSKTARLSDFKGKLVILDMWSVTCTSCIAGFPKMEELQKEFGDKIQILLVNPHDEKYDSEEKIISTLNRSKIRTGFFPSLPIPIHDSLLNQYFPHKAVPHQIWIDGSGSVVAITGPREATVENIRTALDGGILRLSVKNDWAFDSEKPLLVDKNGGSADDFVFRSVFTKHLPDLGSSSGIRTNEHNEVTGFFILNKNLRQFTLLAYSEFFRGVSNSRIIWDVKNQVQFKSGFNPIYTYCYDLTVPATPSRELQLQQYLKDDLKRFFNVNVDKEKRKLKCLVISCSGPIRDFFSKHKKQQLDIEKTTIRKYLHNFSISEVLKIFENYLAQPVIDETHIVNGLDFDFPDHFNLSDKGKLINYLSQKGFSIREEEREVEVIVITDK